MTESRESAGFTKQPRAALVYPPEILADQFERDLAVELGSAGRNIAHGSSTDLCDEHIAADEGAGGSFGGNVGSGGRSAVGSEVCVGQELCTAAGEASSEHRRRGVGA